MAEDRGFAVSDGDLVDADATTPAREAAADVNVPVALPTEVESKVAHSIVRVVMAREARGLLIKREHFNEAYVLHPSAKRAKFAVMLQFVQDILKETYGLELAEVAERTSTKKRRPGAKQPRPEPTYCLVSVLSLPAKKVLGQIWRHDAAAKVPNGRNEDDQQFFVPKYRKTATPLANIELVKHGILAVVVALVALSENRVSETDLLAQLSKFGLSSGQYDTNSTLSMTTLELLAEFTKREYLSREAPPAATGGATDHHVDYTLGRRSLAEFTPRAVFELLSQVYGEAFELDVQHRAMNSIMRAFGVDFDIEALHAA
ncbi:MAGE domain-containing protein [[Candida] zeylanoides]